MMSVSKLSHGDGYAYYTAMTASGDQRRAEGQELADYYVQTDAPEGRWVGRGCKQLGVSGTVSEAQMKALFGESRHPDADRIEAEIIANGGTVKQADMATRLGRRPYRFDTAGSPLGAQIKDAQAAKEHQLDRPLTVDEIRQVRMSVAATAYKERFGQRPGDNKELATFLSKELGKGNNSVAGFDLTFSPPKSVSVLWGLSDEETSRAIEEAHEGAIQDALAYLEKHAIGTRAGARGVAQLDVSGIVATQFRHHDSRDGDPQLHDHVVVANRVYHPDSGKWRTLDGACLYRSAVSASECYNRALVDRMSAKGYTFTAREMGQGKRPVMEVAGVDQRLMSATAKRSAAIRTRTQELVDAYRERHGREPGKTVMHQLRQQATLETRTAKGQQRSLSQMRQEWRREAAVVIGEDKVTSLEATVRAAGIGAAERAEAVRDGLDIIGAGEDVIREISEHRATWAERDIRAEVDRWAARNDGWKLTEFQREAIAQYARDVASIDLTPPSQVPDFAPLQRADGSSIYEPRDRRLFTSARMLDAEYGLLDAAREEAIPAASAATFDQTLALHDGPLDEGQIALARHFACGEHALLVGIGPAGAGKTAAMKLAVDAIQADGGRVIGLSIAATAAAQLEESTGAESTTIAQWLHHRRRHADGEQIDARFTLSSGDVLLVDEAGMAGTQNLAELAADARAAGAHIRLIGDDRQLQAVESGGALRMIASEVGAPELAAVHRFHDDAEKDASLRLRHGDLSWYEDAGRIHAGRHADLVESIIAGWDRDDTQGRTSLMMADTNDLVAELNGLAQERRVARGDVDLSTSLLLRDGHRAGIGDTVVTRRVDRQLSIEGTRDCVKNGDAWTVTAIHEDGTMSATRKDGKQVRLPAEYVRESTELGYASTVHRAQGRTVDVARSLATDATSREGLYVAMTRGRHTNELYVATDDQPRDVILSRITRTDRRDIAARDAMLTQAEKVDAVADLARQHQDVTDRADALRYTGHLRQAYGPEAERVITSVARSAVDHALRELEDHGYDVQRMLTRHQDLLSESHEDPGKLLSWRLRRDLREGQTQADATTHRPLREVPRDQLDVLAAESSARRAQAREVLLRAEARHSFDAKPIQLGNRTIPAWSDRAHGSLTSTELSEQVAIGRYIASEEQHEMTRARKELQQLRTEWRTFREKNGSITSGRAQILASSIREAEEKITEIAERQRAQRTDLAQLRTEQQLRRDMPKRAWVLENIQRETQRQRGLTDREHIAARAENTLALEDARRIYTRENTLDQQIRAEQRARAVEPDHVPAAPVDDLPRWIAPDRGMTDQHMPPEWKQHLAARRQLLTQRLQADGQALALRRPTWTRELGPVPEAGPQRARWERTAGQINAWRDLHDYRDDKRALPEVRQVPERDRADLAQLRRELPRQKHATEAGQRTSSLQPMDERIAARKTKAAATAKSAGQQRAEEQLRRRLEQRRAEEQRGQGPVQR